MKKFKMHLISISIIIFMLIFGLSTQPTPGVMNISIKNNSSINLNIEIIYDFMTLRNYECESKSVAISIKSGEIVTLENIQIRNMNYTPDNLIHTIIISNDNEEITKYFSDWLLDEHENVSELLFKRVRWQRRNRTSFYEWVITDELLE